MLKGLIAAVRAASHMPAKPSTATKKKPGHQTGPRSRDPWYSDLERRAEINARSSDDGRSWIPRRAGWLRSRGVR